MNHRRSRLLVVVLAVAVAVVATGCKGMKPKPKEDPKAEGSTTDMTSGRSMQVMNYYVDFFNELIDEIPDLTRGYWERAGDAGLDVDTMTKWGNVVCAGAGWMKMKREEAKQQVGQLEKQSSGEFAKMPPLAKAMYDAAIVYAEKRDAMCAYVKGGEFKADAGAKAKTLHADLVTASAAWGTAVDGLAAELERVEDAQSNAELAKHEATKSYGYWFRLATIRCNEFLRVARRDAAKAEAGLPRLEEALAGFVGFAKDKANAHGSFVGFGKQVDRMQQAIAKLKPALAKASTPAAKGAAIEAAMENLLSIYNTMVSLHNTLVGAEGNGQLK
jgi:hypothetical protein